jgi:outer membrane protein insertion porin family
LPAPALFSAPDTAVTTPSTGPPQRIGTLSVVGNARTDSTRILRSFEVAPGSPYSKDALRRGLRKLFTLGLFADVWLEELRQGDAVDLVIHVRERPSISSITFEGNKKRESSELEKKIQVRVGEIVTPTIVRTQVDSLLKYYRDEGFGRATVDAATDTNRTENQIALKFLIHEGEKVRIRTIRFEGATAFTPAKLRKQMKSKKKGFFGGGELKEEQFTEDREKLEAWYHNHRYRDARVTDIRTEPGRTSRDLTLVVTVDEGRPYNFGNVTWEGNHVVADDALHRQWPTKGGKGYDASRIERAQAGAYAEYAEHGYLYVSVEPQESVRGDTVDVAFTVTEGRPSTVRMVNITGNHGTREKVIRREIDIHEGDRFKRSQLVRTQGDIFRLGLFEDVQIDFTPAESTDVDINLKVKEKQVGTASAGAGYTSESGLTGFLELGHNNVLGNGQSLQLHLERGGKREDYSLSFTEPWFRDTPTLLGFSLFDTHRQVDFYDEKRVGGSVRIGRPLPWPDYSRGSISYRLEDVTITASDVVLTAQDSIALAGLKVGVPELTSSAETYFARNSTDNPFYPTHGTRLELNDEFAGGPFGGSVNYHKHRWEGRLYLPSLLKGVTTMAKARFGILAQYPDQNGAVPSYERFRLGGGSTIDPLRGYDDYQVVPSKFNYFITNTTNHNLADPQDPDSITTTRTHIRYPGGRVMTLVTLEQQFPIVHPLHGVLFFDAGNTWDTFEEIRPLDLKLGAGIGFRLEIPLLGNIGLDYGYGFNRDDGPRFKAHFLLGNVGF